MADRLREAGERLDERRRALFPDADVLGELCAEEERVFALLSGFDITPAELERARPVIVRMSEVALIAGNHPVSVAMAGFMEGLALGLFYAQEWVKAA